MTSKFFNKVQKRFREQSSCSLKKRSRRSFKKKLSRWPWMVKNLRIGRVDGNGHGGKCLIQTRSLLVLKSSKSMTKISRQKMQSKLQMKRKH